MNWLIGYGMSDKIIFLIRNVARKNFGGGEIYQLKLAEKLKGSGFEPIIVTNSQELIGRAEKSGFKTLVPPYIRNQNWSGWRNLLLPIYFGYLWRLGRWYEEIFKYYKPELVNIQSRDDFLAGTMAARKYGIRILWTDHADFRNWVLWNVNTKYKNIIGKKIIKLSRKVEKVIFVSEKVAEETAKMIYPKQLKNTVIIENGVDDKLANYKDVSFKNNSFVYVGRVVDEKGIGELVKAFMMVVKKYPKAMLNIYGDGEIQKFKKMCEGCDNVKFHGPTDETIRVLVENEMFVLPSYREGLSLSLLEAAMMEKKIIASDVDGNPEVVVDGETGLLVPVKNVEKLAETMLWMLEHKSQAERMAQNVRKRYEKKFNFEKIFEEKMLPLYNGEMETK